MDLRQSFSESLLQFGKKYNSIVVLTADSLAEVGLEEFQSFFGERIFNFGLGYRAMLSAAAGFAVYGKIPFIVAEDSRIFLKAYDQLKNGICEQNLNIKICVLEDEKLDDLSLLYDMPNLRIIVPSTEAELADSLDEMMLSFGPTYLRIPKKISNEFFEERQSFNFVDSKILKKGSDATLIACGRNVDKAFQAAAILEKEGLSVAVLDLISVKPFDEEKVLEMIKNSKCVFTVAEHKGLSSIIGSFLMGKWPILVKNIDGNSSQNVAEQISMIMKIYS